ncbi:MAG: uracil-xanthine permease [Bacilli bacterium]|nr:uracil-xanthine permease [Bacilli bacterium]
MQSNELIYQVGDRPKFKNLLLYSTQLLLAILAATVAVPVAIGVPSQIPSAILGAGVGTIVYILFTKGKSPIVVSSSFAYIAAFPSALAFGYCGILLGGILSGLMYVIIAIIVKFVGVHWINRILPPVIIGPVVALIGLSLAGSAMGNIVSASQGEFKAYNLVALLCGLVAFFTVVICSVQMRYKGIKLIPFIIGILVGYGLASIFTAIGNATNTDYLKIIDWTPVQKLFTNVSWQSFFQVPHISLAEGIKELITGQPDPQFIVDQANFYNAIHPEWFMIGEVKIEIVIENAKQLTQILVDNHVFVGALSWSGVGAIVLAFCPIAIVSFAEHLADHKNMSRIIEHDLLTDPGLTRTLLGDGVGSISGTVLGICPNTSYGEGIACVAMTRNASVITTFTTACICIILSFLAPFSTALQTIPSCVMGGICLALYGYISVSGLRMFKDINLDDNTNLLTVCSILISGIGGLILLFPPFKLLSIGVIEGSMQIGSIATAMLLGIATYHICRRLTNRTSAVVSEVNEEVKYEDYVRRYLKRFEPETLATGLLTFGFIHENVDFTVAQLSNYLRSEEMLNNRTVNELVSLIKLFQFKGYKPEMSKNEIIQLIRKNCQEIDKRTDKFLRQKFKKKKKTSIDKYL